MEYAKRDGGPHILQHSLEEKDLFTRGSDNWLLIFAVGEGLTSDKLATQYSQNVATDDQFPSGSRDPVLGSRRGAPRQREDAVSNGTNISPVLDSVVTTSTENTGLQ